MLAGDLSIADDPELAADSLRANRLTERFNASDPSDPEARLAVLRQLLGSLGDGAETRPPLRCEYGYQTHIGARTFINCGVILLDVATIRIGDDVQIGPNVQFLTPAHPVEAQARRAKLEAAEPITIADNKVCSRGTAEEPRSGRQGSSHMDRHEGVESARFLLPTAATSYTAYQCVCVASRSHK
jgi:maltose O-acetyltransferase